MASILKGDRISLPTATSDPSSPSQGDQYYNTTDDELRIYNGTTCNGVTFFTPFSAAGGTEYESGGYKYHKFTSSGTLVVAGDVGRNVEVLMVAGGGGGGRDDYSGGRGAGGGGAGGCLLYTSDAADE